MDEITKHTLKLYKTIRNPFHSLSKKIVDIFLEILIIVFAVSFAQFLERQREHSVKQKEAKEFLLGLKNDMKNDIEHVKNDIEFYNRSKKTFLYLSSIKANKKPNPDSLNSSVLELDNNAFLIPSLSRFEGYKSSGKLEDIEDKKLLQNILYYYELAIPQLQLSESGWKGMEDRLSLFFTENRLEYENGSNNNYELILKPEVRNTIKKLVPWPQLFERNNQIITLANTIVKEIDKDFPDQ